MLARMVSSLPAGSGWAFEPKFDGFRALGFCSRAGVPVQSRQQRLLTGHFPDVAAALAGLALEEVILDGELVIWNAGRFNFTALQDRLRSGPRRAHTLAAATPAAYVVFDLLAPGRTDLRGLPYQRRRAALETLLGRGLPAGLCSPRPPPTLTPSTTDAAVAKSWLTNHGAAGIEGVVAKRFDQFHRSGVRGWQKVRTRLTAEAVVGGVIGPLDAPRVLLLGRHDTDGHLQLVGRTTELTPTGRAAVVALLRPRPVPGIRGRTRCRPPAGAGPAPPPPTPRSGRRWSSSSPSTPPSSTNPPATRPRAPRSVEELDRPATPARLPQQHA